MKFDTRELDELAMSFYEDIGGESAQRCASLLRAGDYRQLVEMSVDPRTYDDAYAFARDYAAISFLRKCADLPTGIDTGAAAIATWYTAESECYRTNERLSPFVYGSPEDERLQQFVLRLKRRVEEAIGHRPPPLGDPVFGPGATISDRSLQTTLPDKLSSVPTLYHDSWPILFDVVFSAWGESLTATADGLYRDRSPQYVSGNVFFTVQKDATTDRGCAKEASLNAAFQRRRGIDLSNALQANLGICLAHLPELHSKLACEGSLTGEICTIDLRTASDTQAYNLIKLALPGPWFDALECLRARKTLMPDTGWVKLEKFSSMGNGFTFELETIVFRAIVMAAIDVEAGYDAPRRVSVFGDDIVVDTKYSSVVMSALQWCGLTPNTRKTFTTGKFRESCGGDFFNGVAVKPFKLKELPSAPQHWIGIANGIRARTRFFACDSFLTHRSVPRSWHYCLDRLPRELKKLRGPVELGDTVIHDTPDRWVMRVRSGVRYVRVFRPVVKPQVVFERFSSGTQLAAALYLAGVQSVALLAKHGYLLRQEIIETVVKPGRPFRDVRGFILQRPSPGFVAGCKIGWTPFS